MVRVSFEQYRYEYYTVMKQWKDLQREASKRIMHYHDANYLNLSLAEQGVLLDHFVYLSSIWSAIACLYPE